MTLHKLTGGGCVNVDGIISQSSVLVVSDGDNNVIKVSAAGMLLHNTSNKRRL